MTKDKLNIDMPKINIDEINKSGNGNPNEAIYNALMTLRQASGGEDNVQYVQQLLEMIRGMTSQITDEKDKKTAEAVLSATEKFVNSIVGAEKQFNTDLALALGMGNSNNAV